MKELVLFPSFASTTENALEMKKTENKITKYKPNFFGDT